MPGMAFVPDFGSVPDWVEALGTSGALIFLAVQYRRDRQRDRKTAQDAADARRDDEARQARLISVKVRWVNEMWDEFDNQPPDPTWFGEIQVINDSSQPIRDICPFISEEKALSDNAGKVIKPALRQWWAHASSDSTVVRPGQEITLKAVPRF